MMQRNQYLKSLEDTIAEISSRINTIKTENMEIHPERKIKELTQRKKSLEEVYTLIKLVRKFGNDIGDME